MTLLVGVTPLIGAIFAKTVVHRSIVTQVKTTAILAPMQDQFSLMNTGFMMTAYGSIWHGQKLPSFTTPDSAILPFKVDGHTPPLKNVTWTSSTIMYYTTLDCKPAAITESVYVYSDHEIRAEKTSTTSYSYDNGKGCKTEPGSLIPITGSLYGGLYISYYMDFNDWSLEGIGCPAANNSHTFIAVWGRDWDSVRPNVTAVFCESAYWSQEVNATVEVPGLSVSNIIPLSAPKPVAQDTLNITNFEYMVGTGSSVKAARADISHTVLEINQRSQLMKLGIDTTDTNMVGFAMGGSNLDPEEYMNSTILASSFERAHKLLFAIAFRGLLSTNISDADSRMGVVNGITSTVVVVRILALIVEVSLGLVIVFALALLYASRSRGSQLHNDPASLTEIISMITPGAASLDKICDAVRDASDEVRISIIAGKFHLDQKGINLEQPVGKQSHRPAAKGLVIESHHFQQATPIDSVIRPLEMRLPVGLAFVTVLLMAIMTLVALQAEMRNRHGLALPSRVPAVTQLVLNYVPIVFAAFIEPTWIMLNRLICVLQPFESLRTGDAKASASLDVRYTSLPPQLVIWRAFRARHYLLTGVCFVGISANVLAVAFSGLFMTDIVPMDRDGSFAVQYLPTIGNISNISGVVLSSDHIYAAQANFSGEASRPAWVGRDTFFLPFSLDPFGAPGEVQTYKATTQGFGVDLECYPADMDTNAFIIGFDEAWNLTQQSASGRNVICGNIYHGVGGQNKSAAALEVLQGVSPRNPNATEEDYEVCNTTVIAGFVRANLTVRYDRIKTDETLFTSPAEPDLIDHEILSSLWLACRTTLRIAPYEVQVDQKGNVQSYTRKAPYATDLSPFFVGNQSSAFFLSVMSSLLLFTQDTKPYWHNDTFVDNWFGYFVKTLTNSTDPVDPAKHAPSFDFIAPVIEDIYSRLFAITLGLHHEWFIPAPPNSRIEGEILVPQPRVFMSRSMFVIVITLLVLNIIVAIAYYAKRPKIRLPRMPNTVASVFELFKGSGLVAERAAANGWKADWRFGYGSFVGTDGAPHLGIERRPFVVSE